MIRRQDFWERSGATRSAEVNTTYSHCAGFGDDNARDKLAIPPRFSEPMGKKGVQ
jgi:hypothetical protein